MSDSTTAGVTTDDEVAAGDGVLSDWDISLSVDIFVELSVMVVSQ